jgi:hypothetical protein
VRRAGVRQQRQQVGVDQIGDERERLSLSPIFTPSISSTATVVHCTMGRAQLQQREQRVAGVQVAHSVRQVALGQQRLRDDDALRREEPVIALHQVALAYRRQHLPDRNVATPAPGRTPVWADLAQPLPSRCDRARSHEDDLRALFMQSRDLACQRRHDIDVEAIAAGRQQVRPQLRDDAAIAKAIASLRRSSRAAHSFSP